MIPEAPLERTEEGVVPAGPGWFIVNAREAPWRERPGRGAFCEFESPKDNRADFEQLGVNVTVLRPGEPMAMYHHEADQEDFLLVAGEAILVIEEQQRALRPWDLVHCPAGTEHVIVAAGSGPCVIVATGARDRSTGPDWGA
jgi:mannose-6-phosphate isomerase-like protein (cupin superfamily)